MYLAAYLFLQAEDPDQLASLDRNVFQKRIYRYGFSALLVEYEKNASENVFQELTSAVWIQIREKQSYLSSETF